MKIVNNYTDKVSNIITSGEETYTIAPGLTTTNYNFDGFERLEIILNVLSTIFI